jgi:hypothetical protein
MNRWLSGWLLAAVVIGAAKEGSAQAPDPKSKPEPTGTVIRLKVQAAHAPTPALKYHLLPELHELNPGNPIQAYLNCFSEQNNFFYGKQSVEDRIKWLDMPLQDLPVDKIRGYGGVALRNADAAARLDNPDWQMLLKVKNTDAELRVPEVGQIRRLGEALHLRLRGEIADHRFDDALVTMQTLLALSRHMAEHPTSIGFLVSISIASFVADSFEEMIAQPGCPNLFWALANLPQPFVDIRRSLQSRRMEFMKEFDQVDDKTSMTENQVQKVVDQFQRIQHRYKAMLGSPSKIESNAEIPEIRAWFADRSKDQAYVASARKRMIESGTDGQLVERFPSLQVVFLNEKRLFLERRDDRHKGQLLPYWQFDSSLGDGNSNSDFPLARMSDLFPVYKNNGRQWQATLEQRFAVLRCIEALRLHAAENDGKLPARLADVKLPLPVDPMTGKAFEYRLDGDVASLHPTPPRGRENDPEINKRYEVTITR